MLKHVLYSDSFLIPEWLNQCIKKWEKENDKDCTDLIVELLEHYFDCGGE